MNQSLMENNKKNQVSSGASNSCSILNGQVQESELERQAAEEIRQYNENIRIENELKREATEASLTGQISVTQMWANQAAASAASAETQTKAASEQASAAAESAKAAQEALEKAVKIIDVGVDDTLTVSGMGADAAVTGEKINTLQSNLDTSVSNLNTSINAVSGSVSNLSSSLTTTQTKVNSLDTAVSSLQELVDDGVVREVIAVENGIQVTYTDGTQETIEIQASGLAFTEMYYDTETYYLHLYDEQGQDVIDPVYIPGGGGSGGGGSGVTLNNETYVNGQKALSLSVAFGESAKVSYTFVDTDPDFSGVAAYYVNGTQVATANISQNVVYTFDAGQYLVSGDNKIKVIVTDENGATGSKTWTISALTVSLTASLSESTIYSVGEAFRVTYVPTGTNMVKTTHFLIDGEEVASATTSYSGRQMVQALTINEHGAHDIDIYTTTTANEVTVSSSTIHFCIAVKESGNNTPIITVKNKSLSGRVYTTAAIQYMVYNPVTEQANITQTIDGISTSLTVGRSIQTWAYKPTVEGEHNLSIACGEVSVDIVFTATELGYDIHPANVDTVFDFDPSGRSNSAADRDVWESNGIALTVDDEFDWVNGGYQQDEDGVTAFVIRAGHKAIINYNLFGSTSVQANGASFKMIFKAQNVRSFDAVVAQCLSDGIGLDVNAKEVTLSSEQTSISQYICEGEYTELVYNITSRDNNSELFINLQGVPSRFATYSDGDRLNQRNAVPLTIGSDNCDVWLYRCKYYDISLGDADIMDNFIADAPNSEDMIARYERNAVDDGAGNIITDWNASSIDEAYIDNLAVNNPGLRVIKMWVPRFTTDKSDKVSSCKIQHLLYGARLQDRWTNNSVTMKGQGTSSNAYGKAARNVDIDCKDKFIYTNADGEQVELDTYDMTDNSVGETYFNIKLNVASSENLNNAMLAELMNKYQPYKRDMRQNNAKVRDTMEFHPCAIFVCNESAEEGFTQNEWIFYGIGDFGNSKKNKNAQGLDKNVHPNECIVELCNNTHVYNRFKEWKNITADESWETDDNPSAPLSFRYISDNCDEAVARQAWQDTVQWVYSTDRTTAPNTALSAPVVYNGVTYVNDTAEYRAAKFVNEFDQHFESDSTIFHYLFTSYFIMPDNRAKNTFPHCEDVTAEHPIWDYCFGYDFDTAMGINNEGDLALDYGLEDIDQLNGGDVFNAQDSVIWINVRDLLTDRINTMVASLTELFNSSRLNAAFDAYQSVRPERLLVADARRKYIRPYEDLKENGAAITMFIPMMNGTKELQRHYFLKYQNVYFASKFNTSVAKNDKITLRGFASPTGEIAAITITPYSDLYVAILFGSILKKQRCKRGEPVTLSMSEDTALNDTEIYIYSASMLEAVEGIASVYTNQVDFSAATKLKSIIIGSDDDNYSNTNLTSTIKLDFSALANLEELRIDHCPNLNAPVDVSGCVALRIVSCKGTPVSAVNFASGSVLEECYLEQPVSLSLRNMQKIKTFEVADNYAHLTGFRHENTPYPVALDIVELASSLYTARILDVNWQFNSSDTLNRLVKMSGYDENGIETEQSVLSGDIYLTTIRQSELDAYTEAWTDARITYGSIVQQYKVTFCNWDGTTLTLKDGTPAVFYIDRGAACDDPISAGLMNTPTRESTVAAIYTYDSWDKSLSSITSNTTVTAIYTSTPQKYTVRWYSQVGTQVGSKIVEYGEEAIYDGDTPERSDEEANLVYNVFDGWNKSTAKVTGNIDVYANWIRGELPEVGSDLTGINYAQLAGIKKSGKAADFITTDNIKARIPVTLGYEPNFDNVESKVLAENLLLDGTTNIDTGVSPMKEDSNWTIVVDGVFDTTDTGACMVSCFDYATYQGFQIKYTNGFVVQWATSTKNNNKTTTLTTDSNLNITYINQQYRELVVLRHVKGEKNLRVYMSIPQNDDIDVAELSKSIDTVTNSTIVLGSDNAGENFAKGHLYRCKIWYDDLGDAECRKMAAWPREEIYYEITSSGKYYQTDGSKTNVDLIMASLLCAPHNMNSTNTNAGGWLSTGMRTWLNKRYLQAIPEGLRNILAEVKVNSCGNVNNDNVGEVLASQDKVYLPSHREMNGGSKDSEPYVYCGTPISYFTDNNSRIKFIGYTIPETAVVTTSSAGPQTVKDGDIWIVNNNGYIWNGNSWVISKYYWLRDAYLSYSYYFWFVNSYGNVINGHNATFAYGVAARLHL